MWNYEHEVILNDVTKASKVTPVDKNGAATGGADRIVIKNEGNYLLNTEDLQGNKTTVVPIVNAFKTVGVAGTPQTIKFDKTQITGATAPQYYRFAFQIKCDAQTAEFANWAGTYAKPIIFEVAANTDSDALVADVVKAALTAIPEGIAVLDANDTTGETIVLTSPYFSVVKDSISVVIVDKDCDCSGNKEELETPIENAIVLGTRVKPFGTYEELMGIRRDSMTNLRTPAEFPIKGKVYTQFAFDYDSERVLLGGMSAVSQAVASRTHHVFWVPNDDAGTFEALFGTDFFTEVE